MVLSYGSLRNVQSLYFILNFKGYQEQCEIVIHKKHIFGNSGDQNTYLLFWSSSTGSWLKPVEMPCDKSDGGVLCCANAQTFGKPKAGGYF